MVERGTDADDRMHGIACGDIVKDYSDNRPCPSFLMLGNSKSDQRLIYGNLRKP